tara:strand:- start:584 stop:1390 length:807 start_codon:yes stop_codon:yes gene_type:complete
MYGTTLNYDSHFFISGGSLPRTELSGIESLDISYQNSQTTTNPLGYNRGVTTIAGPTSQNVSFSRFLIYDDPVLSFTGANDPIRGSFNYDDNASYGFNSGYLVSYSVNCAVGAIPKVNASFVVYDEMKSGAKVAGNTTISTFIPSQGSITATCDNTTTSRVVGFDYSLTTKKIPYYTIGKEYPCEVKHIDPIEYTASVQLEVDDVFLESGYSFLQTGKENRTVTFDINGRDGTNLQSLSIPNASLVSESLNASAEGVVKLTLNYVGHQ